MSTTIYVTWDATKKDPLENFIADEDPIFNLCIFDYSGHYGDNRELLSLAIKHGHSDRNYNLFSITTHGKGEILNHIANHHQGPESDYIGVFDDDILIRISDLNRAILIGESSDFASFQPSLARCSHFSHGFTVNQEGSIARKVAWIEIMMPIMKRELLRAAKPFLEHNVSAYGLDCFVFPILALSEGISGGHAVIDASIASHIKKVTPGNKVYRNGLTARQEMHAMKDACKKYLSAKGIAWEQHPNYQDIFKR